jgi:C-terminal processing protease CtpA/Prc
VNIMSKFNCLVLAGLLVGANAYSADAPPPASPAASASASASTASADLEAQLAAARQKLEAAARDVAQLSAQLGQSAMARVQSFRTRAVLGLTLQTESGAKDQGATVTGVSPGGPAAEAGIASGDVIVALNGEPTTGPNAAREVVERMGDVKPDAKVSVKVLRDGKSKEFQVTARANVSNFIYSFRGPGFDGPGPHGPIGPVGPNPQVQKFELRREMTGAMFEDMELADVSAALGQYFGATQGVLVIRAPRDAEFLKLQDGDVIVSIDGRVPENGSHATRILRSYQPGEKIHLKVIRQKKTLELEGALPERRRFGRGPGLGPEERELAPGEPPPPTPPT